MNSYIMSDIKKTFKVFCNVYDLNSWSGNQHDSFYSVDLSKIITDPEDYKKPYEMTFAYRSRKGAPANSQINMTKSFELAVDIYKGYTTQTYNQAYNIVGIIPVANDYTVYDSGASTSTYLDAKPSDNEPVVFPNLDVITGIRLTLINSSTGLPHDPITFYNLTRFVCILTFKQL